MIVDDDPLTRKIHSKYLKDPNWHIIEADSGEACLKQVAASDASLIVLDLSMPKMDGYEVVAQLKLQKETADIPVILLTAQEDSSFEINKSYEIGVSDFLTKPADPKILRRKAAVYINQYQRLKEVKTDLDNITERYNLIFNCYPNPAVIIDEKETVVDCNSKMESLLDYSKGEVVGKNTGELIHSSGLDKFRSNLKELLNKGIIDNQEYKIVMKDDKETDVTIKGRALNGIAAFEIIP
jgi:PAS domain S-box-containing protein